MHYAVNAACRDIYTLSFFFKRTSKTRPHVAGAFSKTENFFSEYGYRPHVTGVFGHRIPRFSNTLSEMEIFENGD